MNKQRVLRTPLIAVLGLLAFLIVPAAAQAHEVSATASCKLVGDQPTVTLTVEFKEFGLNSQSTLGGTVSLDGVPGSTRAVPPLTWSYPTGNATFTETWTVDGGSAYTARWSFTFRKFPGADPTTDDGSVTTETCPEGPDEPDPPKPAIQLEKTGAATAAAGSTFTYFLKATNTGNVTLTTVVLTDDKCQATLVPVAPADATLTVGESQDYTCTVVAPAGPAQVDNLAEVCGWYDENDTDGIKVCDDDPHTFTVPPPGSPPETPPTTPPTTPPPSVTPNAVVPEGEVLPESILSGRAQLRGPSGCVKQAFRARVSGRSIASVTFFVDGRKVKTVRRGNTLTLKVNPRKYGLGRHKLVAVVRFRAESETKARKLPLTFRRCAQGAVAPRFTG
jgi:hypothetical protein